MRPAKEFVVNGVTITTRTNSYIRTMLWASMIMLPVCEDELVDGCMDVDEDHPLHGIDEQDNVDDHFDKFDLTKESLRKAQSDCDDFFAYIEEIGLYDRAEERQGDDRIAHDFWLTRNGHGVGFWDGDYEDLDDPNDKLGQDLTDACRAWGSQHVFCGEEGDLHLEDG